MSIKSIQQLLDFEDDEAIFQKLQNDPRILPWMARSFIPKLDEKRMEERVKNDIPGEISNPFKIIEDNDDLMGHVLRRSGLDVRAVSKEFRAKHAAMDPRLKVDVCTNKVPQAQNSDIDRMLRTHEIMDVGCLWVQSKQNEYHDHTRHQILSQILAGLPNFRSLSRLSLSGSTFDDEAKQLLSAALPLCESLTHLDLSRCKMYSDLHRIARLLPRCRLLSHLDLSDNKIGPLGIMSFAGALPECPNITHLDLSENSLVSVEIDVLAAVLPRCRSLTHLNLKNNLLNRYGIEKYTDYFRNKCEWEGQVLL